MRRVIKAKELQAKRTVALARWLIGKHLVRRFANGRVESHRITEVEAYDGERDLACHARVGLTSRTRVMYAIGGVWYVYLCYGVHEMLNLVVGPRGWPAAVLIRGLEGLNGPGRLTRRLGIGHSLNGQAAHPTSGLWLEDRGIPVSRSRILATPRVGVDYAGPIWAGKRWRFVLITGEPGRIRNRSKACQVSPDSTATGPRSVPAARRRRKSKPNPGRA